MLHIFCNGYTRVFLVFQTYVVNISAVSDVLNVVKIDRVLHMLHRGPPAATTGAPCIRVGSEGVERSAVRRRNQRSLCVDEWNLITL